MPETVWCTDVNSSSSQLDLHGLSTSANNEREDDHKVKVRKVELLLNQDFLCNTAIDFYSGAPKVHRSPKPEKE